ncbi:MAG: adenylyl-sulfate kinase [Acidimicrobiia bacterium]
MTGPVWHAPSVTRAERRDAHGLDGATVWLTGLSGSGKSTIANGLARTLLDVGRPAYVLDGDNLRHGLNAGLGYSDADRTENVRRVGEVARLVADAGLVAIVPIISPFRAGRDAARAAHAADGLRFLEVHVATPLAECERRDTKGFYAKVRAGEMTGVSGVDAPYEPPTDPDLVVGQGETLGDSVRMVFAALVVPAGRRDGRAAGTARAAHAADAAHSAGA